MCTFKKLASVVFLTLSLLLLTPTESSAITKADKHKSHPPNQPLKRAEVKEAEAATKKLQAEAAISEAKARGPLREELIRLSYADPEDVARTLQACEDALKVLPRKKTRP